MKTLRSPANTLDDSFCTGCNGTGRDCVLQEGEFKLLKCQKDGDFATCGQLRKMCPRHPKQHLWHAARLVDIL